MSGFLEKMRIYPFLDANFSIPLNPYPFEVYYNPASYDVSYSINYDNTIPLGGTGEEGKFLNQPSAKYTFDLIFDGTGASAPSAQSTPLGPLGILAEVGGEFSVTLKVKEFLGLCYNYVGAAHRTPLLILNWGTMVDRVVLTSATVTYTLFSPKGVPLRAKIHCTFDQVTVKSLLGKLKDLSPDLTHTRVIKEGDTLHNLCKEIYGDTTLYQEVAKANSLVNFRQLEVGSEVFFPPLKTE